MRVTTKTKAAYVPNPNRMGNPLLGQLSFMMRCALEDVEPWDTGRGGTTSYWHEAHKVMCQLRPPQKWGIDPIKSVADALDALHRWGYTEDDWPPKAWALVQKLAEREAKSKAR